MKLTKSIISSLLVGSLACTGCSSVDDFDPTEAPLTYISFDQPVVTLEGFGANTRSSLIKTADLTEFTVCGFCVPQNVNDISKLDYSQAGASWSGKSKFCRPNVFGTDEKNVTATVRKNGSSWEYDNVKQWVSPFEKADDANKKFASDAKFTFIAWANGDFRLQGFSTEYAPKLEFYMPFTGGTKNNPVVCDHNKVKDALIAARYDHEKIEGSVPLHFQHILTAIRFRIANHSDETLTIKSMSFTGQFFGKATFTYETSVLDQNVDQNSNCYWGRFNIVDQTNPDVIPANTQGRIIGVTEDNRDG
ncbi:MAG: fimbrillin family protein, partial [Muribaculaceae bacterium]|nr:fimbrillin family protein [Muribaculaceae bacterium]